MADHRKCTNVQIRKCTNLYMHALLLSVQIFTGLHSNLKCTNLYRFTFQQVTFTPSRSTQGTESYIQLELDLSFENRRSC